MTIDFYYTLGSAPCRSVLLTIKLLGLDVNLKELNLLKKEQLAPEFVKLNPQHTVPTLVDDGFVIWESYAIITYLVQKYAKTDSLYPKDAKKKARVDQRLYFDMGTLYRSLAEYYFPIIWQKAAPDAAKYSKIEDAFKLLDGFLDGQQYVAGDELTVADVALVATVTTFDAAKFDLAPYKNVTAWYAKLSKLLPDFEAVTGKAMLTKLFDQFEQLLKIK